MLNINKVETLIKEHGWSKSYFSSLFGKNAGWIRDWKRDRGLPDENTLSAIADRLGTTVDYLTDKTDIKNKPADKIDRPLTEKQRLIWERIMTLSPDLLDAVDNQIDVFLRLQDKTTK